MQHALQDGIKYSNGGRALKHLGVPCITLPMGLMASKQMPVGITFATKAYADNDLLRYAYAYETISRKRTAPLLAPALSTDLILLHQNLSVMVKEKPIVDVTSATWEKSTLASQISGLASSKKLHAVNSTRRRCASQGCRVLVR